MSSSKLLHNINSDRKVIIGEYRADIEADRFAEKRINSVFLDVSVITTIEGKKLVPIQELLKIDEQIKREKHDSENKGYESGYEKGLQQGHAEAEKVVQNFASLIKDADRQRNILFEEAHQKILELVLKISRKITFDAAKLDHELTASIIENTIKMLVEKSTIRVKVNPDHLPHIEQQINRFKGETNAIKEISFEPDNRVKYGGCFIETPTGDIDARIESQMEIISQMLDRDGESNE